MASKDKPVEKAEKTEKTEKPEHKVAESKLTEKPVVLVPPKPSINVPTGTPTAAPAPAPVPMKTATLIDMPSYLSTKRVWALQIERVGPNLIDPSVTMLDFTDPRYLPISISKGYIDEWQPENGGYYVLEGNGHQSYLSSEQFESEYTGESGKKEAK